MIITIEDADIVKRMCVGKILVATIGTFDLLHVGHIKHLENCKKRGDYLMVLLSSDERVWQKKGPARPIIPQGQRAIMLNSLRTVDFVIIGFDRILETFRPQIFVAKNPGWKEYREKIEGWGIKLFIEKEGVRLGGTTEIIETVVSRYASRPNS